MPRCPRAGLAMMAATLVCAATAGQATPAPRGVPAPAPPRADRIVGVYYFPGWERPESWWPILANPKVLQPMLGPYDQARVETADWHIKWALDHGVSFFAYDYYTHDGTEMLEGALERSLLRSKYIDRFKFCINWCNHAPWQTMTAEQMRSFADVIVPKYLKHPSCLWLDGKPVVMILSAASFVKNLGVEGARKAFGLLDQRAREAGLPGVRIVSCEGEIVGEQILRDTLAAGVSSFSIYNYPYAGTKIIGPGTEAEAPYAALEQEGVNLWNHWGKLTDGRFWPTVMPGWDRRPWCRDRDLLRTGSTPALFEKQLRNAREHVNRDNIVMIEAWNEWGEGCILEPTVEWGFAYLDKVRSVFCPGAPKHTDPTPRKLGRPNPAFSATLPRETLWTFDRETQGWTSTGTTGLKAEWGALHMTADHGDPQITSPWTFVPCSEVSVLRIRMRVTPTGPAAERTGQVFWDTADRAMSEKSSASFRVQADGTWRTYDIPLTASPRWAGTLQRLRIDPVDAAGAAIDVDTVELVAAAKAQ